MNTVINDLRYFTSFMLNSNSMEKPFSQACENNKDPILKILKVAFRDCNNVLEIGSGTGQHAVYLAKNLPHLQWQPSDQKHNLEGIKSWISDSSLSNIYQPIELNVSNLPFDHSKFDAVFSANTIHIMDSNEVECFFNLVGDILLPGGKLCVYGPFNYNGNYTSESNMRFDEMLRNRDEKMGIRDFEWINSLALNVGLEFLEDHEMPANNRLLEWQKKNNSK